MNFEGTIIRGKGEGAKTGFPTANIKIKKTVEPGIYAGYANLAEDNLTGLKALFYVPENENNLIESHILDFESRDLYDRKIAVRLIYKVRNTQKFSNIDDARRQIIKDEQKAREWFKNNP